MKWIVWLYSDWWWRWIKSEEHTELQTLQNINETNDYNIMLIKKNITLIYIDTTLMKVNLKNT